MCLDGNDYSVRLVVVGRGVEIAADLVTTDGRLLLTERLPDVVDNLAALTS